jgi:hypothetical protein
MAGDILVSIIDVLGLGHHEIGSVHQHITISSCQHSQYQEQFHINTYNNLLHLLQAAAFYYGRLFIQFDLEFFDQIDRCGIKTVENGHVQAGEIAEIRRPEQLLQQTFALWLDYLR